MDLLGALDKIPKRDCIEWIYALQVDPTSKQKPWLLGRTQVSPVDASATLFTWSSGRPDGISGFRGSTSFRSGEEGEGLDYDSPHIAMTYTALASLVTLGDDLRSASQPVDQPLAYVVSPGGP